MTKTVRLTQDYIDKINHLTSKASKTLIQQGKKYPTLTGDDMFCEYDKTNLLVENTGYRHEDIVKDHENVPLYNLTTDSAGRQTVDLKSIHSTVYVNFYILKDEKDSIEIPDNIFNILIGVVAEINLI